MARYARALRHPVWIFIMDYIIKKVNLSRYSGDMTEEFPIAGSTLSQRLSELKNAGLIQGETNTPYIE